MRDLHPSWIGPASLSALQTAEAPSVGGRIAEALNTEDFEQDLARRRRESRLGVRAKARKLTALEIEQEHNVGQQSRPRINLLSQEHTANMAEVADFADGAEEIVLGPGLFWSGDGGI